jgi:hypothetical protein
MEARESVEVQLGRLAAREEITLSNSLVMAKRLVFAMLDTEYTANLDANERLELLGEVHTALMGHGAGSGRPARRWPRKPARISAKAVRP